ncbi:hypothetical protein KP806_22800 [Paenibacillus sp. N4]|uniref:ABC transporter permease n=1 Tax=Paenibacillus vietnamensis TaxID=2590547 RepID=UPI001CD185BC|nr:hypothetical protein [Paenibacillus vietnamensis]MCA0757894.1 hypothetical protein [Paenibacillus vietnamensis]
MSMLALVYRHEMRLLCRNPFLALPFAIQLICWGFVIIPYESQPVHYEEIAAVFYGSFQWIMLVNLLLIGLFAVYMAAKDRESGFELLAATYKVNNTEWVIGKWLVAQTYAFCFTLVTLLVQGIWFLGGSMGTEERVQSLIYVFAQMEGACFVLVTSGFLLGIGIKHMLAYMGMAALLGLTLLSHMNSYGFAYVNPRLNLLTPFDSMYVFTPYESIWGLGSVFEGAMLHQLAVMFISAILLAVAFLLFRPYRSSRREKGLWSAFAVIMLVPAVLAGGIRVAQYDSALEQYIDTGKQYLSESMGDKGGFIDAMTERPRYPFSMDQAQLNVQFPSENRIKADSVLSVTYRGETPAPVNEFSLTLQHQLEITACSGSVKLTCSRTGDLILVQVPGGMQPNEPLQLSLRYEGNVRQYRSDALRQQSFAEADRIYLPKEAGWYPLIGERALAQSDPDYTYAAFEITNGGLVEDYPTAFTVTIADKPAGLPVALTIPREPDGMYKGTTQYGLSLIGGHFEESTVGTTRIVAHPEVMQSARQAAETYFTYWNALEEWLGVPVAPRVIYVLDKHHSYPIQSAPRRDYRAWDVYDMKDIDPTFAVSSLARDLTHGYPPMGEDADVLQRAITWGLMRQLHMDSGNKDFAEWYAQEWPFDIPAEVTERVELLNRYDEKGEEAFRQAVKYVFTQYELDEKDDFRLEETLDRYEGAESR